MDTKIDSSEQSPPSFARPLIFLILALIGCGSLLAFLMPKSRMGQCTSDGSYVVAVLELGNGREVRILAECGWEISQGVDYEISVNGHIVTQKSCIGGTMENTSSLRFETISAANGDLVAIREVSCPEMILILHDFRTGNSWPSQGLDENYREYYIRGEQLLREWKLEHNDRDYYLNGTRAFDDRSKVSR